LAINFFSEEIDFKVKYKNIVRKWIRFVITSEKKSVGNINYIFSSDEYLLKINVKYLEHDYYTDIITFDYNNGDIINGDVYISVERVIENTDIYSCSIGEEFNRVMVHGILHLLGYKDKTPKQIKVMRKKEDDYLVFLKSNSF
jgi:rRNA maturation RNase YbeY